MKKFAVLTTLGILLSACSGPSGSLMVQNTTAPDATTGTEQMMETSPAPTPITGPITIQLSSQSNSGQTGKAILEEINGKVKVNLVTTGGKFTSPQPAHIHVGSCPTPGDVKYPLTNVSNGVSETMLDVDLNTLLTQGPLAINVHKSAKESTVYTACGDITMNGSTPMPSASSSPSDASGDGSMGY